jgi:hypothetical protein
MPLPHRERVTRAGRHSRSGGPSGPRPCGFPITHNCDGPIRPGARGGPGRDRDILSPAFQRWVPVRPVRAESRQGRHRTTRRNLLCRPLRDSRPFGCAQLPRTGSPGLKDVVVPVGTCLQTQSSQPFSPPERRRNLTAQLPPRPLLPTPKRCRQVGT